MNRILNKLKEMFKMADMNKKLDEMELTQVAGGSAASELIKQYVKDARNKPSTPDVIVEGETQKNITFEHNVNNGKVIVNANHGGPIYIVNSNTGNIGGDQTLNYVSKNK